MTLPEQCPERDTEKKACVICDWSSHPPKDISGGALTQYLRQKNKLQQTAETAKKELLLKDN